MESMKIKEQEGPFNKGLEALKTKVADDREGWWQTRQTTGTGNFKSFHKSAHFVEHEVHVAGEFGQRVRCLPRGRTMAKSLPIGALLYGAFESGHRSRSPTPHGG